MLSRLGGAIALCTMVFLAGAPLAAHAADPVDLEGAYVLDTVGAIAGDEPRVQSALDGLYSATGIQLFVVYVDTFSLATDSIAWANETAQINGLGVDDVLLAVAVSDRQYGLSVADGFVLDDAGLTRVERAIEAELRDDQWANAAIVGAETIALEAAAADAGTPGQPQDSHASSGGGISILPVIGGVAVIGVGVFVFSRIRRRTRGPSTPTQSDRLSQKQLDTRAGSLLVQLDDSLKTSEQELGFAVAQFGEAATADFTAVLASAKDKVRNAFAIRQRLDDVNPDSESDKRTWTVEIIQLCEAADRELDSQADAFDELRQLEKTAPEALAAVIAMADRVIERQPAAEAALTTLQKSYASTAIASVDQNVTQAQKLLTFARSATDRASKSIASKSTSDAAIAIRTAQASVGQAVQLFDAIDGLAADLDATDAKLDAAVADTTNDIAAAKSLAPDAALAPAIAAAEAALAGAISTKGDPLASLAQVQSANANLDQVFASVRDAQAKVATARTQLDASITAARAQISRASEFITTRRGAIGDTARTRVSEADRHLSQALALAESDPVKALEEAQRASELAASAFDLASRDVAGYSAPASPSAWPGASGPDLGGLLGGLAGGLPGSGGGSRSASRSSGGGRSRGGRF